MNQLSRIVLVVLALVVVVAFLMFSHPAKPTTTTNEPIANVAYSCNAGKAFVVTLYKGESKPSNDPSKPPTPGGSAVITFPDGTKMTLDQTISADGGRYANADESFVFWGKGNTALILQNGTEKDYRGCIVIAPNPPGQNLPLFYSNSVDGFSIRLPLNYSIDEAYRYQALGPRKAIGGIRFFIPKEMATGTNLASDTYISVEGIPQTAPTATSCDAKLFLAQVKSAPMTDGTITYSVASSTEAAAGNRYEETVYALPGTNPCIAVRYFIHYGVIQNYPPGAVREFDKAALLTQFDAIRHTLILAQ